MQQRSQLSRLAALLDPDQLRWLRSAIYRQQSSIHTIKLRRNVSDPLEPVSAHLSRIRREYVNVLQEIASTHPVIAKQCSALLQLDPLNAANDAAFEHHLAHIRRVLSDRCVEVQMLRQQTRNVFGANLKRLRRTRGLSLRGLASQCKAAAKRLRFRTHSPEHYQIVAYEHGKLLPHPRTARMVAAALDVPLPLLLDEPSIAH